MSPCNPAPTLEASCYPCSWALHGLHVVGLPSSGHTSSQTEWHPWAETTLQAALTLPIALSAQLGRARVWVWSPQGVPKRGQAALLIGLATLLGVSTDRLGVEIPADAVLALDAGDRACLAEIQRAGVQTAIRIVPGDRRRAVQGADSSDDDELDRQSISALVARAHALRMLAIASGVQKRDEAFALAKQGVTAVSGSAVSPPLGVDQMRAYLGPAEAGLETIRADSL